MESLLSRLSLNGSIVVSLPELLLSMAFLCFTSQFLNINPPPSHEDAKVQSLLSMLESSSSKRTAGIGNGGLAQTSGSCTCWRARGQSQAMATEHSTPSGGSRKSSELRHCHMRDEHTGDNEIRGAFCMPLTAYLFPHIQTLNI